MPMLAILLRIMCWNIAEGSDTGATSPNANIGAIAQEIRAKSPDIVLLNEVKHWDLGIGGWMGGGMRQTQRIAELTGLPYYQWGNSVQMGWTGHKVNAVLSRYPLASPQVHRITHQNKATGYAITQTSFVLGNTKHHVFSTRFNAWSEDENISAHHQAIRLLQSLDPSDAVIFGGDFNANRADDPQFLDFARNSGLTNAFYEHPDPSPCGDPEKLIDHVFYRGPYKVVSVEIRCPWAGRRPIELSEHPWVYVELLSQPDAVPVLVPDVTRMAKEKAAEVIRAAGLVSQFTGSAGPVAWVSKQSPGADTRLIAGGTVTLTLTAGEAPRMVPVPDVEELSSIRAAEKIRAVGLVPIFTGSGTWVRHQSPRADTRVSAGSRVTLALRAGPIP